MPDRQPLIPRHPSWPLINIREPHNNDVLCGRGGVAQHYAGNYQYRRLINNSKIRYLTASKKIKPIVARELVATIYRMEPPGRFLEFCSNTSTFFDIGEAKAAQKVGQALREGGPEIRKNLEKLNCDQSPGTADAPNTLKAAEPRSSNSNTRNADLSPYAVQHASFNSANERRPATTPAVSKQAGEIRKRIEKLAASNRPPDDPPGNWRLPSDGLDENTEKTLVESDGMLGWSTRAICPMEDEEELSVFYEKGSVQKKHSLEMPGLDIFPNESYDYVPPAPLVAPARTHFNPNFDSELLQKLRNGSFNEPSNSWLSKSSLVSSEASKMSCKSVETFPMDSHSYSGRKRFSIDSSKCSLFSIMSSASLAWQVEMSKERT